MRPGSYHPLGSIAKTSMTTKSQGATTSGGDKLDMTTLSNFTRKEIYYLDQNKFISSENKINKYAVAHPKYE